MIFFSSCRATEFFSYLLNYVDFPVKIIHESHKQQRPSTTLSWLLDKGILLCTDVVQRGRLIIQYNSLNSKTY
jgi:ATP-dependent RNA helicase DDX18/HAS1